MIPQEVQSPYAVLLQQEQSKADPRATAKDIPRQVSTLQVQVLEQQLQSEKDKALLKPLKCSIGACMSLLSFVSVSR